MVPVVLLEKTGDVLLPALVPFLQLSGSALRSDINSHGFDSFGGPHMSGVVEGFVPSRWCDIVNVGETLTRISGEVWALWCWIFRDEPAKDRL